MIRFTIIFLVWIGSIPMSVWAQSSDSTQSQVDKSEVLPPFNDSIFKFNVKKSIPKRAALYSALLPGLGQVYNKQYWKTGVVALGTGVIGYFIISNRKEYLIYQKDYIYRIDNNPNTITSFPDYQNEDVDVLRKGFRKYYEYSVIAASVAYLINILDAYTSSHLKTFDMKKDISFLFKNPENGQKFGLSLVYTIK